jgi:hypothetical protein
MIIRLLAVYKNFPLRSHCGVKHTLLCRLITPHLSPAVTCKGDRPDWKDWQR